MKETGIKKTLKELAELVGGSVSGDGNAVISGVAGIENAAQGQITFIANPKYANRLSGTKASAIIASPDIKCPDGKNILYTKNPPLAFAKVLALFHPPHLSHTGIQTKADIHHSASIASSVTIYPYCDIDEHPKKGDIFVLYP